MNILFIGGYPDEYRKYNNVFFQNLIYAMADRGVNCTVISPVSITNYRRHIKEVARYRVDTTPRGSKVVVYHPRFVSTSAKHIGFFNSGVITQKLYERCVLKIARKIDDKVDAVYGHFFVRGGLTGIKLAHRLGVPAFVAYGECNYDTETVKLFRDLKQSDIEGLSGIIAVSTHNANVLKSKAIFFGIPMLIAPNAIDGNLFKKMDRCECRKKLGLPLDKFIVGFVGGFVERKGDKRLLDAINQIEGAYVAYAGRGAEPPSGNKVLYCEPMDHEDIPIFLNAIDVFCLPTQNEGSCNAIVEAAACGLPIISSDLPFNDDLLTATNSIRIDPNSVEQIMQAIIYLKSDLEYREKLSKNAYEDSKEFHMDSRCRKILNFIVEVSKYDG